MIGVIVRSVPDLVEGLEIKREKIVPYKYSINELDDYAIEHAVNLKEKYGIGVEVIALINEEAYEEVEESLYTAIAKGVDRVYKVLIPNTHTYKIVNALADVLKKYELILTGVLAVDEVYGILGPIIADTLNLPYLGGIKNIEINGDYVTVKKELGGGICQVFKVKKPAVFGVVSLEKPPRYIPFSKLRKVMQERELEELKVEIEEETLAIKYFEPPKPEVEFIEGEPEEVAKKLAQLIKGIVK